MRIFFLFYAAASAIFALPLRAQQPASGASLPLAEVKPGQHGEVWTVFQGTEPEPFSVEVTGVVQNALGPGKSIILCRLTDPRVQNMGAVAGMSGSPLYIDGKFAGALSYQINQFETVHYAGFTPAEDMAEVGAQVASSGGADSVPRTDGAIAAVDAPGGFQPLRPVFTLSGLSPAVATLMRPYFSALGLNISSFGGSLSGQAVGGGEAPKAPSPLRPGDAVSVALATGDVSLAGTGTVSRVDGNRVIAFGHPMLALGKTALPLCSAEIVTIIPSEMESIKVANTGPVIGAITQDRLSAVSGLLGPGPEMIDVAVTVASAKAASRTLHFQVIRQDQISPVVMATAVTQVVTGSNDAGLSDGFRLDSDIVFSPTQSLVSRTLYAGPQAFTQGLAEFVKGLAQDLVNPYQKTFPSRVAFTVEPLDENPSITLDAFRLSRSTARAGETIQAEIEWRDYQGAAHRETVPIPIDPAWTGRSLEVILAPGPALDVLTGRPQVVATAQLRSFDAYLTAMRDDRPNDGVCVAVVEASELFIDQTESTPDLPGSLARIASAADDSRFHRHAAVVALWESHLLPGKLSPPVIRRPLRVVE